MSLLQEGDPGTSTETPQLEAAVSSARTAVEAGSEIIGREPGDLGKALDGPIAVDALFRSIRLHRDEAARPDMPEDQADLHLWQVAIHIADLEAFGIGMDAIPQEPLTGYPEAA